MAFEWDTVDAFFDGGDFAATAGIDGTTFTVLPYESETALDAVAAGLRGTRTLKLMVRVEDVDREQMQLPDEHNPCKVTYQGRTYKTFGPVTEDRPGGCYMIELQDYRGA